MKINFSQLAVSAAVLAQGFKSTYAVEGQQASLALNNGNFANPYKGDDFVKWVETPPADITITNWQSTTLKYTAENVAYTPYVVFQISTTSNTANCVPVVTNNDCTQEIYPNGYCSFNVELDEACSAVLGEKIVVQTVAATQTIAGDLSNTVSLTVSGSHAPSSAPTSAPSAPSAAPTIQPTVAPTVNPSANPTVEPTLAPTQDPSAAPSLSPSENPSVEPTIAPTLDPSAAPTMVPSENPTAAPSMAASDMPIAQPTAEPTAAPTLAASAEPSANPTVAPTLDSSANPTAEPTAAPTMGSSAESSAQPTDRPTSSPSHLRTAGPTSQPTSAPTRHSHILSDDTNADDDYKKRNEYVAICVSVGVGLLALAGTGVYLSRWWQKQQSKNLELGQPLLLPEQDGDENGRNSTDSAVNIGDVHPDTGRDSVSASNNPHLGKQVLEATRGASDDLMIQSVF